MAAPQAVLFGASATSTTVSNGGTQFVSGGLDIDGTIGAGGTQFLFSGGTASGTTVASGGEQFVITGTVVDNTVEGTQSLG